MIYAVFACGLSLTSCQPIDPQVTLTSVNQCRAYIDTLDLNKYNADGRIVVCVQGEGDGRWQQLPDTRPAIRELVDCLYRNAPYNLIEGWVDPTQVRPKSPQASPCWGGYSKLTTFLGAKGAMNILHGFTVDAILICNPAKNPSTWPKECGNGLSLQPVQLLPNTESAPNSSAVGNGESSHAQVCVEIKKDYTRCVGAYQAALNDAIAQARASGADDYAIRSMRRQVSPEAECASLASAMYTAGCP